MRTIFIERLGQEQIAKFPHICKICGEMILKNEPEALMKWTTDIEPTWCHVEHEEHGQ